MMSGFECQVHGRRVGQQGSPIHVTEASEIILAAVGDVMPTGRHVESVASLHRFCAMLAEMLPFREAWLPQGGVLHSRRCFMGYGQAHECGIQYHAVLGLCQRLPQCAGIVPRSCMCARVLSRLQPASKASNIMRLKVHGAGVISLQHDLAIGCTIGFVLTHVVIHCGHRLTPCVPLVQAHLVVFWHFHRARVRGRFIRWQAWVAPLVTILLLQVS